MKSNVKWRAWIIIGVILFLFVLHFFVKQSNEAGPKPDDDNSGLVIR